MSAGRGSCMSATLDPRPHHLLTSVEGCRDHTLRLLVQFTREPPDDRAEDAAPAAARREVGARCVGVRQAELDGPLDRRCDGDAEALDPQRPDDPLLDAVSVTALQLVRDLAEARVAAAV